MQMNSFRMASPLLLYQSTSQAGYYALGTLLLCAFALFMCASHSLRWRKRRGPVIQLLNNEEMVNGLEFGNGEGSTPSGEVSVWQKNILMGGKCQLPEFSGVIIYDSAGNIVPPPKAAAPVAFP